MEDRRIRDIDEEWRVAKWVGNTLGRFFCQFAVSPEGEPLDHEFMDEMSGRQIACVFANRQTSI